MSLLRIIVVFSFTCGILTISLGKLMAQGFDFDTAFMRNIGAGGLKGYGYSAALQNDEGIIVCGPADGVDMLPCGGVLRYFADGRLDEQFRINALRSVPFRVWKILTQADGKILAMYGENPEWNSHYNVIRLNANGTKDSAFAFHFNYPANFSLLTAQENALYSVVLSGKDIRIMRCHSDGHWDSAAQSILLSDAAEVSLPYRGGALFGGRFMHCNGEYTGNLIRIDSNGKLDKNFRPYLDRKGLSVRCFAACADGKIVIAATSKETTGFLWWEETVRSIWHIMRLNPDGSEDSTFHAPKLPTVRWIRAIYPQEDGKVLVNESIDEYIQSVLKDKLYRFNGDGSRDNSFTEGVLYSDFAGSISDILFLKNGQLLLVDGWGGTDASYRGHTFHKFLRLNSDGEVDETFCFQNASRGLRGQINVVAPLENGQILVAGKFKENYGFPTPMLARLNADGTLDMGFRSQVPPSPDIGSDSQSFMGVMCIAIQPDKKILVGGDFIERRQSQRRYFGLLRLNVDGSLDSSFHCYDMERIDYNRCYVDNVLALPDGKIIITSNTAEYCLLRLHANGSLDKALCTDLANKQSPGGYASISMCVLQPDGKLLVKGNFTRFNGYAAHSLVRLNADGSMDEAFLQAVSRSITAEEIKRVTIQPDGKILLTVGQHAEPHYPVREASRDTIVRLNVDGSRDTAFRCDFYPRNVMNFMRGMFVLYDGSILMKGFYEQDRLNESYELPLMRFYPNGTKDENFPAIMVNGSDLNNAHERPDGKLFLNMHGSSASINGIQMSSVIVLVIPPRKFLPHEILQPLPPEGNDAWNKIFLYNGKRH